MKKSQFKVIGIALLFFAMLFSSCVNDLEQESTDKGASVDAEEFFNSEASKKFAEIHPNYETPGFTTIITGLVVGLPIFFTNENMVLDFTSIGTLFAFVLVCGGVLMLSPQSEAELEERATKGKFRIPYINSKFIFPALVVISAALIQYLFPTFFVDTFKFHGEHFATNISMAVFFVLCIVMSVLAFMKNLSLIPLLGLISCCYLLTGMAVSNWKWFGIWLLIGLVFYFSYGYKNSKLKRKED